MSLPDPHPARGIPPRDHERRRCRSRVRRGLIPVLLGAATATVACGGGDQDAQAPIPHVSAEDEVLRISRIWDSYSEEKGFRTAPSRIRTFANQVGSRVKLAPGARTVTEVLTYDETIHVEGGGVFRCQTRIEVQVAVSYGMRADEAAIELHRPAREAARSCDRPGFPEPTLSVPEATGRFVLRGDRLVPFAPASEKRIFLPSS